MPLLTGLRALDLTDLKGQMCGKLLRDLGMTVIKIEPPTGDPVRRLGPFKDDVPHLEGSLRFAYLNAGKQSLTLDVCSASGRDLLLRLAERVDVVLESFPAGEMERLGLSNAALRERNPDLVITSVTGFGQTGPHKDFLAPDIVAFAMGGLMYISGDPELPPVKAPETQAYYFASVYAALGTLLAVWQAGKDGAGHSVDVSAQEGVGSQEHLVRAFGFDHHSISRHGSQHEYVAPSNLFPTRDGWVNLFVSRPHWKRFLTFWEDHPPEFDDPAWDNNRVRRNHADTINPAVSSFTRRFTSEEFVKAMQKQGIPCLAVNTPLGFLADAQVQARGVASPTRHAYLGAYQQVGLPGLLDGEKAPVAPPPLLGQHTREILKGELGVTDEELEILFAQACV